MSKCRLTCWTIFYHREVIVKEAIGQIQEDLEVSEAQVEGIGFILWKLDRTIQFNNPHKLIVSEQWSAGWIMCYWIIFVSR